ncbi:MAG: DUF3014 domain-containing protein [Nevskiaceae bacterium]|nr:DUF3014 domain-containing protein [Nevskiaceae bacterium]
MSYESEETESDDGRRPAWVMPATALAVVAVVAGGWLWWRNASAPPAVVETPVEAPPAQVVEEQVQHPLSDTPAEPSDAPVPLPALEDSDAPLAAELATLVGAPSVSAWLVPDGVARRFVATVDNLTREKVTERIRAVRPVSGAFAVDRAPIDTATGEERITLASENYARYAPAVRLLTALDVRQVGQLYRTYYPLLQQAYEDLGYPGRYFNDRLVEVIDHLQAAPSPAQPPALVQPKVMYEFADAALESRSAGQKLMIRMGPQNAATVKSWLASLRAEITRITPAGE